MVWPGIEDFGLAPVEAMASGRPVIARKAGGVLDTVVPGETGLFFEADASEEDRNIDALAACVEEGLQIEWSPLAIREHAKQFSRQAFQKNLDAFLSPSPSSRQGSRVGNR